MIAIIIYCLLLAVVLMLILTNTEGFANGPNFIEQENTEFRGINLLGVNSDDTHFATQTSGECRDVCQRNPECKGFSFYQPGQRCYMFMSGDFVPNRPGFYSGKKLA